MTQSVSHSGKLLSISAKKFGLHSLGGSGEKIVLEVVLSPQSGERSIALFVNYCVGRKEAQIAVKNLRNISEAVDVTSVSRYNLGNLADALAKFLRQRSDESNFQVISTNGGLLLRSERLELPVEIKRLYASGGKVYSVLVSNGKAFKLVLDEREPQLFDLQRRRLVGIEITDTALVLQRAFQHYS
jgi:hypothetical protein